MNVEINHSAALNHIWISLGHWINRRRESSWFLGNVIKCLATGFELYYISCSTSYTAWFSAAGSNGGFLLILITLWSWVVCLCVPPSIKKQNIISAFVYIWEGTIGI